jgi:hypothetical protein
MSNEVQVSILSWSGSLIFSSTLVVSVWGYLYATGCRRKLMVRFRFYALRDRFVLLVADDVMSRHDVVFDRFYKMCNLAAGGARDLDLRNFMGGLVDIVLRSINHREEARTLAEQVRTREPAFRDLVEDFMDEVGRSIGGSSTLLRMSLRCSRHPRLKRVESILDLAIALGFGLPHVLSHPLGPWAQMAKRFRSAFRTWGTVGRADPKEAIYRVGAIHRVLAVAA